MGVRSFPSGHNNLMDKTETRREMMGKGVMGLLVGLSLVTVGMLGCRQLHMVWNIWPSTDGVVVRGTVQESLDVPYAKGGLPIHSFSPKVEFNYAVGGKTYTTEAPSVFNADTYEKAATVLVGLYATGTHHPIRYNPGDPREISFGTVEFGPLAFSFLLLVGGVVFSVIGSKSLVMALLPDVQAVAAKPPAITGTVLAMPSRPRPEPAAATLYCASCGRPVKANEETCPNCLKSLRAA